MPRENFDEGQIGSRVGALEHVVEIPDRLMRVNQEDELEFPHRLTSLAALQDNLIRRNCTDGEYAPARGCEDPEFVVAQFAAVGQNGPTVEGET